MDYSFGVGVISVHDSLELVEQESHVHPVVIFRMFRNFGHHPLVMLCEELQYLWFGVISPSESSSGQCIDVIVVVSGDGYSESKLLNLLHGESSLEISETVSSNLVRKSPGCFDFQYVPSIVHVVRAKC